MFIQPELKDIKETVDRILKERMRILKERMRIRKHLVTARRANLTGHCAICFEDLLEEDLQGLIHTPLTQKPLRMCGACLEDTEGGYCLGVWLIKAEPIEDYMLRAMAPEPTRWQQLKKEVRRRWDLFCLNTFLIL